MKQLVQSVERALLILETLRDGEIGIIELADKVGLNKTTVHRLLATLMEKGYVQQNQETSQYRLTPKLLMFGESILNQMDIVAIAKPYLKTLSEETGETVHLVSLEGSQAVYIDKIESQNSIRMYSYIGKHIPLYSTAVGKVFLAHSKSLDFDHWYAAEKDTLRPLTPNTIISEDSLRAAVNEAKKQNFAVDDEENEFNVYCISVPIFNHLHDAKYAISVSSPKFRISGRDLDAFIQLIKNTAAEISKQLGA